MIALHRRGEGLKLDPGGDRGIDIEVTDVHGNVASVTVRSTLYREYLHLVRTAEGWKIVNALWACDRSGQTSRLAERVLAGQGLADDERVHLVRALVREHRLEVVHVPDDRVLERDAVRAEDRARAAGDLDRAADVAHLPEAHVLGAERARVLHPAEVEGDEGRRG